MFLDYRDQQLSKYRLICSCCARELFEGLMRVKLTALENICKINDQIVGLSRDDVCLKLIFCCIWHLIGQTRLDLSSHWPL